MSACHAGLQTSSATRADNRTTTGTSTSIIIEYPLPETHPAYNPHSYNPAGCLNILTVDDVSWFNKWNGEWLTTTAEQPFLDIRTIQTDRGIVIGNFGEMVYRHPSVLRLMMAFVSMGWTMGVERFRGYVERIENRNMIPALGEDLVGGEDLVQGEDLQNDDEVQVDGDTASDTTTATLNDSLPLDHFTPNSPVSDEDRIHNPSLLDDPQPLEDPITDSILWELESVASLAGPTNV